MKQIVLLYLQPIPLDRFIIIDAEATHAGMLVFFNNCKNIWHCQLFVEAFLTRNIKQIVKLKTVEF